MAEVQVVYLVRKPFKYFGEVLEIGDEWHPAGSDNDNDIMNTPLIARIERVIIPEIAPVVVTEDGPKMRGARRGAPPEPLEENPELAVKPKRRGRPRKAKEEK